MALKTLNSVSPGQPNTWPGSQHEASSTLFENHTVKSATGDALKGLHAKTSTLENPLSPKAWNYVDAPRVSILVPKLTIAGAGTSAKGLWGYITYIPRSIYSAFFTSKNKFEIPKGNYLLINRANRAPIKDKWQLGQCYEFPGRAYNLKMNEEIGDSAKAAAMTALHELGVVENDQEKLSLKPLAQNISACAGNNSLIYDFYSAEVKEEDINKLVEQFGAELDDETGVVKINRKCDGGIIDGLELIPADRAKEYFKNRETAKDSIASTTYAALELVS